MHLKIAKVDMLSCETLVKGHFGTETPFATKVIRPADPSHRRGAAFGLLVLVSRAKPNLVGGVSGITGPTADREGVNWNHDSLHEYLERTVHETHSFERRDPFERLHSRNPTMILKRADDGQLSEEVNWEPGMFLVKKHTSPQGARNAAGSVKNLHTHYWGSFLFQTKDEDTIRKIRAALPQGGKE
jgi:hypothetical protein